jgi:LPXTG-site transpeptidase (sortase) family protein
MSSKKWKLATSSGLVGLGAFVLTVTIGLFVYGQFEAWAQTQPRALASAHMIWPDVPPVTPIPSPTPTLPPTPTPTPTSGPPVWLEIPKLGVDRAIVPVGTVVRDEEVVWDVESLFATQNRHDLVGHLAGSANPGQPGNVILAGHNYNWGVFNWTGVFYSLSLIEEGDTITLLNQEDVVFIYQVEQVEELPWPPRSTTDAFLHTVHLSPTHDEMLTLVTCVGANFAPFPSRLYVTAKRVFGER